MNAGTQEDQKKVSDPWNCSYVQLEDTRGGYWGWNPGPLQELHVLLTVSSLIRKHRHPLSLEIQLEMPGFLKPCPEGNSGSLTSVSVLDP